MIHTNGSDTPVRTITRNVSNVAHDLVALTELQAKLFVVDVKDTARKMALPAGLAAIVAILLLATLPVILAGAGCLLAAYTQISLGAALLSVGGAGAVLSLAVLAVATRRLRRGLATMQRSQEELLRNLAWLKEIVTHRDGERQFVE